MAETDVLANLIDRHKPVTNGAGHPIGCQCRDVIGFPSGQTWADHLAEQVSALVTPAAEALREYADLAASREHHMSAPRFKSRADGRERNVWNLVKQELNQRASDLRYPPVLERDPDGGESR